MSSIIIGLIFIIAGIGIAFANVDDSARKKDENKFGPLNNLNMGLGYALLRNRWYKIFTIILLFGIGIAFILHDIG